MIPKWKQELLYITNKPIKVKDVVRFTKDGKLHNTDFPAYISYYPEGIIELQEYYFEGKKHRSPEDGPACIWYYPDGTINCQMYYFEGKLCGPPGDGPACIRYYNDEDGTIKREVYYINGIKQ